jgi:sugar lactone lactonase YvrE
MRKLLGVLVFGFSLFSLNAQTIYIAVGYGYQYYNGDGIQATAADLNTPYDVKFDASGNMYITDGWNHRVRSVNTSGIIHTIAGIGVQGYSGDGGPATAAEVNVPYGIATDGSNNVYFTDTWEYVLRKINASGIITTIAGNGSYGYSGDGGPATNAELGQPYGIACDNTANIYIADYAEQRIRKVNTSGIISTFAGIGVKGYSGDGGNASAAELNCPSGIAFDKTGNMYIADDSNHCIRKVNTSGIISTFAGNGVSGFYGDGGPATAAEFFIPNGIAVDDSGKMIITDLSNERVREINTSGVISTIAGFNGLQGYNGNGTPATQYLLNYPCGAAFDNSDNIYFADQENEFIRKIVFTPSPPVITPHNLSCYDGSNGYASGFPVGGTPPYTYLWSPGGKTTYLAYGLSAGTYTLTVTDANNISESSSVTITQPAELQDSIKKVEITCRNDNNGKTKIFPYGGTSPYTYHWNNGDTREGMSGLSAGTYTCMITDNNGCTETASINMFNPLALSLTLSSSAVNCNGGNTGTASISSLTGGTSPYTYLWAPTGGTNSTLTGASAGTYTLTVVDAHGCIVRASVTVTQPTQIRDSITNIGCGTATVGVRGGTPGYNFRWTPYGGFTATATVTTIGIYTVTITDRNGCTSSTTANITCPIIKHEGDDKPTGMGDTTVCCDESVVLFPNPNRGNFTIELVGAQNFVPANFEIYDVLGQKVYSHPPAGGSQFLINLSQPSGIYFYRVITEDGNLLGEGKIVVQK